MLYFNLIYRCCPDGNIPSGKNQDDILNEVRKEAFEMRKSKSRVENDEDEEDPEENSNSSTLVIVEDWVSWYPQEWIGWVMYGVPSDNPTNHWVHQTITDGPSDEPHYFTDESGKRVTKKPFGRVLQRDRGNSELTVARVTTDNNSMQAQRLLQAEEELMISRSAHDVKMINMLRQNAFSVEMKEKAEFIMQDYMTNQMDIYMSQIEQRRVAKATLTAQTIVNARPSIAPVARTTPNSGRMVSSDMNIDDHTGYDSQYDNDMTPCDAIYEHVLRQDEVMAAYTRNCGASQDFFSSQAEFSQDQDQQSYSLTGPSSSAPFYNAPQSTTTPSTTGSSMRTAIGTSSVKVSSIGAPTMEFDIAPPIRSRMKPVTARPPLHPPVKALQTIREMATRTYSPEKAKSQENPYRGKDYEFLNTVFHRKYPLEKPGVISLLNFNTRDAIKDLDDLVKLRKGDVEDDEELELTRLWVKKIKSAIHQSTFASSC